MEHNSEVIRRDEATGLVFAWNWSHTVNIRHEIDGPDVDCFSFGQYAYEGPTLDGFHEHVDDWLRDNTDEHAPPYVDYDYELHVCADSEDVRQMLADHAEALAAEMWRAGISFEMSAYPAGSDAFGEWSDHDTEPDPGPVPRYYAWHPNAVHALTQQDNPHGWFVRDSHDDDRSIAGPYTQQDALRRAHELNDEDRGDE